ncbi:uncharacterized protein LOC108042375 [Drosophila rhopaloa]|uniref:Uncharacterized protein LOC108042375 n=1 Tax=Drosophila rhopaloa TaxID=1041015 RepID=A0A6P4ESC7_DRORH|nr:uncharacterized protein LOC108042375 [Drosophila rhopaloa]
MSKRCASLMAYMTAEEHLLNCYSPLEGDEVDSEAVDAPAAVSGVAEDRVRPAGPTESDAEQPAPESDLDPAVDSMLHVISDDSDIHSLISSGSGFKGWAEDHPSTSFVSQGERFIYGLCRHMMAAEEITPVPEWTTCTPAKRPSISHEVIEINDSPESAQDPAIALMQAVVNSPGILLTNGNVDQFAMVPHGDDDDDHELQVAEEGDQCVIYESVDGENMVVLAEEHCCEIIVATQGVACEQEFARAILMAGNGAEALLGLLPEETGANECLNGAAYIEEVVEDLGEDEARMAAENNVYLSDAALEQPLVHQELVEDEAPEENENATFLDDTPMEEERPDICQVYDHELEDHDDEDEEGMMQQTPGQPIDISVMEGQEPPPNNLLRKLPREHSSPTEFPVSSSSMPNASYNYEFDDDLMGGHSPSKVAPLKRKYPPLMKNTLHGEAMDRRLASICQAQPQMSPAEKVSSWETAASEECAAVEDVESFAAAFDQYEAATAPLKQLNFIEFRESLARNLEKISRDIMQTSDESTQEQASSQSAERPVHRRYLHIMPTEETIVLDDDDDDCYEVVGMENASVTTLIPEEELQVDQQPEEEEEVIPDASDVKTMETKTSERRLLTKETSTTDLESSAAAPTAGSSAVHLHPVASVSNAHPCAGASEGIVELMQPNSSDIVPSEDRQLATAVLDVMRQQVQMQQQQFIEHKMQQQQLYRYQDLPQAPQEMPLQMAANQELNFSCPNDSMFYEQQEFCNYLGLTELATANAVATAMRELANSTVARRSLRVRPQHQLDRMRSDVRGKRRERERDRQQDKDKKMPLTTSSELSTDKEESSLPQIAGTVPGADGELTFIGQLPASIAEDQRQSNHFYDTYLRAQGDRALVKSPKEQERLKSPKETGKHRCSQERERCKSPKKLEPQRCRSPKEGEGIKKQEEHKEPEDELEQSVKAAFAKVYEAAAPAQSKLLEKMQQRLRQARETKPSIYIIKATNNASPQTPSPGKQESRISPAPAHLIEAFGDVGAPCPSAVIPRPAKTNLIKISPVKEAKSSLSSPVVAAQSPKTPKHRKTHGVTKPVTATKRRRTTVGAPSSGKHTRVRDLVTRSTTHLNSKLLRNRKVSLLKSYALSDEMAQGRAKRLSGGTALGVKRVQMPKIVRAALKRPDPTDKSLPEQHRLQQQQLAPPNSPRKIKGVKENATVTTSATKAINRLTKRTKRTRAKSLPGNLEAVPNHTPVAVPRITELAQEVPNALVEPYKHLDNSAAVGAAELTHIHSPSRAQPPYAQPALIYPPSPTSPPLNSKEPRRSRQHAGHLDPAQQILAIPPGGLLRLSEGSSTLANPLSAKHGKVLYMYYELEQLIVLQENCITFWKFSKVFNVLHQPRQQPFFDGVRKLPASQLHHPHSRDSKDTEQELQVGPRWVYLGRVRRLTKEQEIFTPFGNRICVHNSTPVYLEMRSRPLDHHKREVKLTSLHVNVYYFCEEELRPRMHSVHLDAVNCEWPNVIYTTIAESRYFVMAWQQELVMGKPRSGICKYSLTPTLDTLASIREFKQLRHELRHIECLSEDRLIGYGQTRITIWDHRSGDTLMNYDLGRPLGSSLAAMHYPSLDMDQSSMLVLYQHVKEPNSPAEVHVIACELSHATPSHRLLQVHRLPSPQFDDATEAVNTGDHLIIKSASNDEAWISAADPRQLTYLAPQNNGAQRFYARQKSQVIEMSPQHLTVDSIANHMLKLAVQQRHST